MISFPLYFVLFQGSHGGLLNGFSLLFAKFDSSHDLWEVPMGTSECVIGAKWMTGGHSHLS